MQRPRAITTRSHNRIKNFTVWVTNPAVQHMQRTTGQGATAAQGRARLHAPPQATTVKRTHNSEANSNDAQQWSSQLWRTYILHARSLLRRLSHFCIIMTKKIGREPVQWVILTMSHLKSCKFLWTWYFDQMGRSSSRYCISASLMCTC